MIKEKRELTECNAFQKLNNMIEHLETLLELQKHGTMAKTSTALRITQSAVSKRIAALEVEYGVPLIEKSGRNVALTPAAEDLLLKVQPLISELKEALRPSPKANEPLKLRVGVSESILSSWGPRYLSHVFKGQNLEVEYHAHRSPLVIEKVESGALDLGLCAGKVRGPRSLIAEPLKREEMVIIAQNKEELRSARDLMVIEKSSATWKAINSEAEKRGLLATQELESFFSIAQLAKSGFGRGLVPIGVAKSLGISPHNTKSLTPKLYRPIQFIYRKSQLNRSAFAELSQHFLFKVEDFY